MTTFHHHEGCIRGDHDLRVKKCLVPTWDEYGDEIEEFRAPLLNRQSSSNPNPWPLGLGDKIRAGLPDGPGSKISREATVVGFTEEEGYPILRPTKGRDFTMGPWIANLDGPEWS